MAMQSARSSRLEIAVGGEGPPAGQAHLTAVGVAREDGVVALGGEGIKDTEVRRVGHAESDVGRRVGQSRDFIQPVVAEMWVIDAGEREQQLADTQGRAPVGQVDPTGSFQLGSQLREGQCVESVARQPSSGRR